jgi:hypothetical protein
MPRAVTSPITGALVTKVVFGTDLPLEGMDVEGWSAALGIKLPNLASMEPTSDEVREFLSDVVAPAIARMSSWIHTASLDDLVNLTPPSAGTLTSTPASVDLTLRQQYRWAVDHFATTFYGDWTTSSLHYEFRWFEGEILPPCPVGLMSDRDVPIEKLTKEIAQRVVFDNRESHDSDASLVREMYRYAKKLLGQGRCREAAAVFEFGAQQVPRDADIRNNLGFCLIPVAPSEALGHLQMARNMGFSPSYTNAYNQMCCYVSMRRPRAALNVADSAWKDDDSANLGATLWKLSDDGIWKLFHSSSPSQSLAIFATEIARREGWSEEEAVWQSRVGNDI